MFKEENLNRDYDKLFLAYCKDGDLKSLKHLYQNIKPWLFKMILRIVGSFEVAEDILQETWIKVLNKKDEYREDKGKFQNLIFTIAKNGALIWVRDNINILKANTNYDDDRMGNNDSYHQKEMIKMEMQVALNKAINKLSKEYQDVILLYYYSELDIKEVSIRLNIPEGTVKNRLFRAREKMKVYIIKQDVEIQDFVSILLICMIG